MDDVGGNKNLRYTGLPKGHDQVQAHLKTIQQATTKVFSVEDLNRESHKRFSAVVAIAEMLGQKKRIVRVTHQTNAGMGDFNVEFA